MHYLVRQESGFGGPVLSTKAHMGRHEARRSSCTILFLDVVIALFIAVISKFAHALKKSKFCALYFKILRVCLDELKLSANSLDNFVGTQPTLAPNSTVPPATGALTLRPWPSSSTSPLPNPGRPVLSSVPHLARPPNDLSNTRNEFFPSRSQLS